MIPTYAQYKAIVRAERHGWSLSEVIGDTVLLCRGAFTIAVQTTGVIEVA